EYDVSIQYLPGKENVLADWLSRIRPKEEEETIDRIAVPEVAAIHMTQMRLPSLVEVINEASKEPTCPARWHDDVPVGGPRGHLYIPQSLRPRVLYFLHGSRQSGHVGVRKTYELAKSRYWWPNMQKDIAEHISKCTLCHAVRTHP